MLKKIMSLVSMVALTALLGCGSSGPDDPAACVGGETYDGISRICVTPTDTDTSTETGTDTGTATQTTVTTTTTATDTSTATWPAYCNGDSTAAGLGSGVLITGLWNVTCKATLTTQATQWNLYITVSSKGGNTAGGYAFKTAEIDVVGDPPSLTEYKGVAVSNCLWLNPVPLPTSTDKSAEVLNGTMVSWTDPSIKQITGGDCTMEWRAENQDGGSPHYWPGAGQ